MQEDIDLKFKKFKQMARAAVTMKKDLEDDFEQFKEAEEKKFQESCENAKKHIENLVANLKEKMENGSYPEMTNMLLSIKRSEQLA